MDIIINKFNELAEALVLAGDDLGKGIENENMNQSINNINKSKDQLNHILYECAKNIIDIKNTLEYCLKDIENNEAKLSEDERILLESYCLDVYGAREKINEELYSLSSKINRIADTVLPDVIMGE